MRKQVFLFVFASALYLFGLYTLLFQKIGPFFYYYYLTSWWSYIIFLDTSLSLRHKRFLVLNKDLPFLITISSGYWCFFELINIRLENWFYINLPPETSLRYLGYFLGFGTVIPAIYITKEAIKIILGKVHVRTFRIRHYSIYVLIIGTVMLILTVTLPGYCFALAWIFPFFLCDGFNYLTGRKSIMADFNKGQINQFIPAIVAGLVCGFLWEFWNYWSLTKWVYTVPFFEGGKIFEMPLAGYMGFLIFGLGTITFKNLLQGTEEKGRRKSFMITASIICSVLAFPLIDKYTVFSYTPKTEELSFLQTDTRELLSKQGAQTAYEIDPRFLKKEERQSFELMRLKGLGYEKLSLLKAGGIDNINDLAGIDADTLSMILKENNQRRVRVYLKAAKNYSKNISLSY